MADVFISYARQDVAYAREIADVLKTAGYEVWWDSELLPHHAFGQAIEHEIHTAKAVLVVWSEHAINSQWVRAEADLARSEGKLVQVVIDGSALPLPFNQYQTADLQGWPRDPAKAQWAKVLASIGQLTSKPADTAAVAAAPRRPKSLGPKARRPHSILTAVGLGLVLIAAVLGAAWLILGGQLAPTRGAKIAVRPFETIGADPQLRIFAASLSDTLRDTLNQNQLQTVSRTDAETLQGADIQGRLKALDVGLLLSGTAQAIGPDLMVRMNLDDPIQHTTLWSAEIRGPAAEAEALQAQAGARTIAVLNCSAQALDRKNGLTQDDVLALFLRACDLAETSRHGSSDAKAGFAMLETMREVTRKAPNFAAGHSILAKHAAYLVNDLPGQEAALRQEATSEAHRALALNPKDADAYVALGLIAPTLDYGQQEHFFRLALAANPSWPHANGFLGNVLTDLGRLEEASSLYDRAASVNPLGVDWNDISATGLVWAGHNQEADDDIARFERVRPDDKALFNTKLTNMISQHKWAEGFQYLDTLAAAHGPPATWIERRRLELTALNSHSPQAMQAARENELSLAKSSPQSAITGLALLGFVDDAFALANTYSPDGHDGTDSPRFLFSPLTAPLRRDVRFMGLANKFGLPQYWLKTGKWPDFCADPTLPYNCKAEAEKMKPVATQ